MFKVELRALWREGTLTIDGRVWAKGVSVDKAAGILAEVQREFPKSAPRTMFIEPKGWAVPYN